MFNFYKTVISDEAESENGWRIIPTVSFILKNQSSTFIYSKDNAKSFKKQGFSYVIEEENLTDQTLLTAVKEVYSNKDKYIKNMSESGQMDSISTILSLIKKQSK